MIEHLDIATVVDFGTALLVGALVGIERQKHDEGDKEEGIGGLRTFILLAELGAIGGWLARAYSAPWVLVAALAVAAVPIAAGYVISARQHPEALGLTTEIAALVTCLLGGLTTLGYRELAVALGVITAATLAYKQPLHGLVKKLGDDDVFAGVRLLVATFIVLPLLPDKTVDPWGALNPYSLWQLVLLISSLSLVGYVATRWLGSGRGSLITGASGGLVSSTAVTLSFSRRSREENVPAVAPVLAAGIILAWCIMFARVVVEVLVVNRALVASIIRPFGAMALVAGAATWILYRRGTSDDTNRQEVPLRNPFSLTSAAKFAAFFAVVLLLVKIVQQYYAGRGVYALAALAGLTDVDAITLSMAEYGKANDPGVAVNAIVIAALSNTAVKCGMAVTLGGSALRRPMIVATLAIVAAGVAVIAAG